MRRLFPAKGQKYLVASAKAQKHRNPVACCWPTQTCSYVEKVIHVDRCRTPWYSSTSRYSIGEREEASQALARADGLGLRAANMDGLWCTWPSALLSHASLVASIDTADSPILAYV